MPLEIAAMHDRIRLEKFHICLSHLPRKYLLLSFDIGSKKCIQKLSGILNINVLLPLIKITRQAHNDYQNDQSSTDLNSLHNDVAIKAF